MLSFLSRLLCFLSTTRVFFGVSPSRVPGGSLIFFPVYRATLCCGLAGFVAYKRRQSAEPERIPLAEIEALAREVAGRCLESCGKKGLCLADSYLCPEKLARLSRMAADLKRQQAFVSVYNDPRVRSTLASIGEKLSALAEKEQESLYADIQAMGAADAVVAAERIELLQDIGWILTEEVAGSCDRVRALCGPEETCEPAFFRNLDLVLSSLDRLEVRGRDSAGISVMIFLDEKGWKRFELKAGLKGIISETGRPLGRNLLDENTNRRLEDREEAKACKEEIARRLCIDLALNGSVTLTRRGGLRALSFVYKIAAEIGRLGDNVAFLRGEIAKDALLRLAARNADFATIMAHTRWASVGAITEPNCHPLDNSATGIDPQQTGIIHACLNGDIDNYAEIRARLEQEGILIPDQVTTDTKIIPLLVSRYVSQGLDITEAFRRSVSEFTGSHAIFMQTDLAPGKLFIGHRGSGQAVFVGVSDEGFLPVSEVYGFVALTDTFVKMRGDAVIKTEGGEVSGQVFVLDRKKPGISGISAFRYDGEPVALTEKDLQRTAITTRDTDRGKFPHYFLKEISQSPSSVEKTLLHRWEVTGEEDKRTVRVKLTEKNVPESLRRDFAAGAIRRIFFIGQGTAGIAAQACAELFKYYLKDAVPVIAALKASEFSGFVLCERDAEKPLSDALVVAITQSGTTTDTNRAVDMVKAAGGRTLAIVNRRDSDITFKVDGVVYTSSGRDIEMSVASTKAFYSQIVAGAVLGLFFAQEADVRPGPFVAQEIRNLARLPGAMREVLANQSGIAASAKKLAVTRTYWAVVGSGPNKSAADEIRIKLSELCYKTISSDFVEDKKHIDLSSEPLILVCAAGSPEAVLSDIVKDVAIFTAHKAAPVVIADQGEGRFDEFARDVLFVPPVAPHLSPILSTLTGHIWGYHAALAINEGSGFLYDFRQEVVRTVDEYTEKGEDIYEVLLESRFRERVARFYRKFRERKRAGQFPSGISGNTPSDLTLLCKYLAGRLPVEDFLLDFGVKGTPGNILGQLFTTLAFGISQLARPVDAIKHQAKTVTVGTSRIAETAEGLLFDTVAAQGFRADQLSTGNVLVVKNIQKVVEEVVGLTLYRIDGLSVLGDPVEGSTITLLKKEGTAEKLKSRAEHDRRLSGTKRIIVARGNVYMGKGRKDNRSLLAIPIIAGTGENPNNIEHLILLEVKFKKDVSTREKARALGGKYDHIKNLADESGVVWDDSFLDLVPVDELFGRSAEKIAEAVVAKIREPKQ
ncbi:MAG: SIS domain-containing protein [Thermodesulfobacteriota bacterium]